MNFPTLTKEGWTAAIAAALANIFAVAQAVGWVSQPDSDALQPAINTGLAGLVAFLTSVVVVVRYLKETRKPPEPPPMPPPEPDPAGSPPPGRGYRGPTLMAFAVGCCLLFVAPSFAQQPSQGQLMRDQTALLQQIVQQQQQIITLLMQQQGRAAPQIAPHTPAPVQPKLVGPLPNTVAPPEPSMASGPAVPAVLEASYDASGKLVYYTIIQQQERKAP